MSAHREKQELEEDDFEVMMFIEEPHDPRKKPMYCKHKVYSNGQEFSLEEIRARRYLMQSNDKQDIANNYQLLDDKSKLPHGILEATTRGKNLPGKRNAALGSAFADKENFSGKRNAVLGSAFAEMENLPGTGKETIVGVPAHKEAPNNGKVDRTYHKSNEKENESCLDDMLLNPSSNFEFDVTSYTQVFNQPPTSSTPLNGGQKRPDSNYIDTARDSVRLKKYAIDIMSDSCISAARTIKELSTIEECNSGSLGSIAKATTVCDTTENVNSATVGESITRMPSIIGGFHCIESTKQASRIPCSIVNPSLKSKKMDVLHGNGLQQSFPGQKSVGPKEITNEVFSCAEEVGCMSIRNVVPDPHDCDLLVELLKDLKIPVSNRIGYYSVPGVLPMVKGNSDLHLRKKAKDGGHLFKSLKMIGQGAYAKVYKGLSAKWNKTVALKIQKPPCPWEYYISNEIHERVTDINMRKSFLYVKEACFFTNGSVLISDLLEYGTLLDCINIFKMKSIRIPEVLATYFTLDVLRIINCLHSCKIIHADIKPDNFLIKKLPLLSEDVSVCDETALQLIDLGRCIDMSLFPSDSCFTTVFQKTDFQCIEMRKKKPWTYQVDYFQIASLVHVLVFGEYMDVVIKNGIWSVSKKVPRNLNQDLWNWFFSVMLNIESCSKLPSLAEIIKKIESVYQSSMVKSLLPAMSTLKKFINEEKSKKK